MRAIGGLSQDQADALIMSTRELATQKNVIPSKVFADVTEDAEFFAKYAKDGGKNLLQTAVAARQLGSNLAMVAKVADSLMDFESSVNAEMEASVLLGRDLNLDAARRAALVGDTAMLQQEILKNVGTQAEFESLLPIEREKLAQAMGLSTSEVLTQIKAAERQKILNDDSLTNQQKMATGLVTVSDLIGKAITAGMDAFGGTLASIGNLLIGTVIPALTIVGTIIGVILTPIGIIAEGFNFINEALGGMVGYLGAAVGLYGILQIKAAKTAVSTVVGAIGGIWDTFMKYPFGIGIPMAIAAVSGLYSMISKAGQSVGDAHIGGGGATIMTSGTSGGIFNTRADDEVNVGPKGFMAQAVTNGMLQVASMQQQGSGEVAGALNRLESGQKQRHLEAQTSRGVLTDQTKRNRPGEVVIT